MKIKKQILLPKNAFALANDEDVFINLQLNKTFSDIKTEKINNVFNYNEQYNSERQSSLKFCIFGLIESRFANTGGLIFDVTNSTDLTLHLPKISTDDISEKNISIKTFELTIGSNGMSRNLYGNTKSAYSILFEIDRSELETQDEQIRNNGGVPKTRTIDFSIINSDKNIFFFKNVPFLFYDLEGNPVSFGTQTADVDEDGNTIEINNDFDFLYDRHWIRNYFDLPAPSFVSFTEKTVNIQENVQSGITDIEIALDQKSPFGLEEATIIVDVDNTIRNPNQDFNFITKTIKWNVGEQYKTFDFNVIDDKYVEGTETLTLKAAFFKNCIAKNEEDIKMEINIINDDTPSEIRFLSGSTTLKSNASAFTVSYVFNKPIEVPNQSIELYYTTNTTAVLGKDFVLDINNPTSNALKINFNQGDVSGSTTIKIIDNDVYDIEKTLELSFKNQTQNIVLSNVGAVPNIGPVFIATIQDSLITQFASFVIINNPTKKIGAIRAYESPDSNGKYRFYLDSKLGFGPATNYQIQVRNIGEDIVFENKLVKKNSLVKTIVVSAQQLTDIVIEMPSNTIFDKPNKKYKKAKYEFNISSKEKFISATQSSLSFGTNLYEPYPEISVDVEKNAGPLGSSKYYLTTKLQNYFLNYNKTLSACTIDGSLFEAPIAYTNNIVFQGYGSFNNYNPYLPPTSGPQGSVSTITFEDYKMPSFCSQFYPFAFEKIPNPPYVSKYININFRNVYPQSSPFLNNEFNNLRFDTVSQSQKRGFVNWSASSIDTRNAMVFSILNNGDIPVDVLGINPSLVVQPINIGESLTINSSLSSIAESTEIAPGQKILIRGFEKELQNISLTLPTNESYIKNKSGFTIANYILSVENVVYFNASGKTEGSPASFSFDSTNTLVAGSLSAVPQYFIVSEYKNIRVPIVPGSYVPSGNSFGSFTSESFVLECGTDNFNYSVATSVAVRGLLLPNSSSAFKRGYFVDSDNDLQFSCTSGIGSRIPFRKLT